MATVTKLGPTDHGRHLPLADFETAEFEQGYKYELIEGKLYVTYEPNCSEDWLEKWVYYRLLRYSWKHPKVINHVTNKPRVFLPNNTADTIPEPDLAAYRNFPVDLSVDEMRWEEVSPLLVGEILSANDPHKDLIRNVRLYLQVPSIREYWIIDGRRNGNRPRLLVYRRRGKRWQTLEIGFGETYTTPLLPRFKLVVDPRN